MRSKFFRITSEAILIFISAVLGAFTWNHGSDIFNYYKPSEWLEALLMDIVAHPLAWIAFAISLGILLVVLCYRTRYEYDSLPKTAGEINKVIRDHIKKLNRRIR